MRRSDVERRSLVTAKGAKNAKVQAFIVFSQSSRSLRSSRLEYVTGTPAAGGRRRGWWLLLTICLLLTGLTSSGVVRAQDSQRQRAFVYGINAALENTYTGSFAPPSVPTLYLLADQTSVISPRMTEIYFWAITNEYKASWELTNEPVAGTLEIVQGGQVIQQIEPTSYTIHYQTHGSEVNAQLFVGRDADTAQARFSAEQQRYQADVTAYHKAQQDWIALADDANQRAQKGEKVTIPPAPQEPEPIGVTSNGINQGIPVRLPAGSYQMRLRGRDGAIVPDSTRALEVFGARRTAIGYMVVPETRWTTPEQVDDLSDVIVGMPNSQIYLVPHTVREFPAHAYALLQDPQQQVGGTTDWTWVMGASITAGQLEVVAAGQAPERLTLTPYRVSQVAGTTLGYQIQQFVPDPQHPTAAPDLVGFPIQVDQPGSGFEIRMVSPQGELLAGSSRLVRTPSATPLSLLLLLSALPLVVGIAVIVRRRMQLRLPRNSAG